MSILSFSIAAILLIFVTLLAKFLRRSNVDIEARAAFDEKSIPRITSEDGTLGALPTAVTESNIARDSWVLRLTQHVCDERHRSCHNVLVINEELEYFFNPEGVVEEMYVIHYESKPGNATSRRRAIKYRVTVFESGSLVNLGDGGDINWDWKGNFDRTSAKTLTFKPCVSGVKYQQDSWQAVASP
ncbi:hypothetical protein DPSP01_002557 [Paraphaeosphaeria sporulosa]|uniref:Uncharacterized protein n=1 Tax=Paraphaeosphaeria sporulosa TaxID=1460663 RepID=A0A177CX94_9PLEO|nr:uncharacterized protein CC84DRAFT_37301 [Paraphaeosphaeria sporulosa]OAG11447.1 hypothetical protein CC84DRAFT_37301 [Paraphaeosphaeria sporulosa]